MDEVKNNNIDAIQEQDLASVSAGATDTDNSPEGFLCPSCKKCFLKLTLFDYLYNSYIVCPICGIRLDINKQADAKTLDELRKNQQQ